MEISEALAKKLEIFKKEYGIADEVRGRVQKPPMPYIGEEVLEMAVSALLEGENLLLCGDKATGKNLLAENLAWLFGRPLYNISFHVNTDSSSLIGTDTFVDNEVGCGRGPSISARPMAALGCWMRSTWRKTTRFPCFTPLWITAGLSTCPATTGLPFTRQPALSPP